MVSGFFCRRVFWTMAGSCHDVKRRLTPRLLPAPRGRRVLVDQRDCPRNKVSALCKDTCIRQEESRDF